MIINLKNLVYNGAKLKNLKVSNLVLDRLSYELKTIEEKGYTDYFILYSRIIEICNELKLIRSFGRGSAPASLVNYCLDITNINPLEHNFRFERFIPPKQNRFPDIDIDIPRDSKNKVLERLRMKYREYNNYSIAYLPEPGSMSDREVYYRDEIYKKHKCGTIITKEKLVDSVFTYEYEDYYLCQDYHNDKMMDYKFDLLELGHLESYQYITSKLGDKYHPYNLPLNDTKTFETLIKGETKDIYGFNFSYLKDIFQKIKLNSIEDLYLIFAMNRPPLFEFIPKVIENKNYNAIPYCWTDKRVQSILDETYGVLVYEETFTDLLVDIAGFDFEESESWRKTFAHRSSKQNDALFIMKFSQKCSENSILIESEIAKLSAIIVETAKWAYPKSHTISHAMMGYWGAYYKTHFPKEFEDAFDLWRIFPNG